MTYKEKTQLVNSLLKRLEELNKQIGDTLIEAESTLSQKDKQSNTMQLLLGTVAYLSAQISDMQHTYHAMLAVAKTQTKD